MPTKPPTGEEKEEPTCSLKEARGCLGLMCAHYKWFLKPFWFTGNTVFPVFSSVTHCRFHPVLLDCAKRRKHSPCGMDLTTLEKSRYWSLHNGKEKQDLHYPGATKCFEKTAAWQRQSPHAARNDRCWSAVRLQPVWSCMVGNREITYQVLLTFVSYQKHAYYTSFNVGTHKLLV